ncbi:MAG TPA: cupin domain-containing protein [Polyangia bacterium]|jgi:putative transcriptional regulator|nr:cupin domain-containing protein [Polyangia bacterium]
MTPTYHPTEEALLEYAGGASAESAALVYACHASLCAPCARRLTELEAVGGALLEGGAEEPVAADALARALASLDAPTAHGAHGGARDDEAPAAPEFLAPYHLPRPLARVLAALPRAPRWQRALPGVRTIDLAAAEREDETRVRLVAFKPGVTIPPHDHGGTEHVLVFTGAIEEPGRRFGRGDLATRERGERHEQRIAAGELCVALVVNEGPLVPLTLRGRLLLALARG